MRYAVVKLECIGDNETFYPTPWGMVKLLPSRAWIAKIVGYDSKYIYKRNFIKGIKDYSHANSVGSRGVYKYYHLTDGLYEIKSPQSWKWSDRYFAKVKEGKLKRITEEELIRWLEAEKDH